MPLFNKHLNLKGFSGWNRFSIGYFSSDGFKCHNYPFTAQSYGPPLSEGDVLGVGYRPRTGAVFFTRNGKKLDDAFIGLTKHNLFPTVAADGSASIHVNLGQAGFVFIEANVKKWGLAPMIGTLAPPPAYGSERGSILLETAGGPQRSASPPSEITLSHSHHHTTSSRQRSENEIAAVAALAPPTEPSEQMSSSNRHSRGFIGNSHRRTASNPNAPIKPSPLRASMTRQRTSSYTGSNGSAGSSPLSIPGTSSVSPPNETEIGEEEEEDDTLPHNPPTPGQLDISLRAMSPFSVRADIETRLRQAQLEAEASSSSSSTSQNIPISTTPPYNSSSGLLPVHPRQPGDISPPSYQLIDSNQYPAGVAEAMLDTLPEEQFAALFANINYNQGQNSGASSSLGRSYEGRTGLMLPSSSSSQQNQQSSVSSSALDGLGLRGMLGSVWKRSTPQDQNQPGSNV